MCLPDFVKFEDIPEDNPLTGFRNWRVKINNPANLMSERQDYVWPVEVITHKVANFNSGIYAYNNYNYNNYKYKYNNYNYNNYKYKYNNYNYKYNYNYDSYYIFGIIKQYGRVAIHKIGQRSEYARVNILFSIRASDAKGPKEFLKWIDNFNILIDNLALKYDARVVTWQDYIEGIKNEN